MNLYLCDNCGFWQRHSAAPASCPVCTDFRHTPPQRGFQFLTPEDAARDLHTICENSDSDIVTFRTRPKVGIGPNGYLIRRPEGNLFFDGTASYDPAALDLIESLGGIRWLSASHPHAYGALWQLQERFSPVVVIQVQDLSWTNTFRVTWPYDERLDLDGGARLIHTGGHFAGHTILSLSDRRTLFAGDMLKFHSENDGPPGISTHKAFNRQIPMSHAEVGRYAEAISGLDFGTVYTTFESAPCTPADALRLFDAQRSGPPFFGPVPLGGVV